MLSDPQEGAQKIFGPEPPGSGFNRVGRSANAHEFQQILKDCPKFLPI